jgi:hypothetical protein
LVQKKRSDVTGAVASVPKTRLEKIPVTNIMHAIGRFSLQVLVSGNSLQYLVAPPIYWLGAKNTITAGHRAFHCCGWYTFSKTGSVTNDINPNDVASIEVFKRRLRNSYLWRKWR